MSKQSFTFPKPVCVYSNYCNFSIHLLNILKNSPLYDNFQYVCVDFNKSGQRPNDFYNLKDILHKYYEYQLNSVPIIILEERILYDKDLFDWLNLQINTLNNSMSTQSHTETEQSPQSRGELPSNHSQLTEYTKNNIPDNDLITGFNVNEMTSFSDQYSTFGNENDVKSQSFQFLNDTNLISTPVENGSSFKSASKNVRFQNDNLQPTNLSNKGPKVSKKEQEFDSNYEQLMMPRQMMDKQLTQITKPI